MIYVQFTFIVAPNPGAKWEPVRQLDYLVCAEMWPPHLGSPPGDMMKRRIVLMVWCVRIEQLEMCTQVWD